jgi:hypothetical protein
MNHQAATPAIERIARVLAGQRLSVNAKGDEASAGAHVDQVWPEYRDDALAVLRTLREPDQAMAAAGDTGIWERMIAAALAGAPSGAAEPPEPGTAPFTEGP